MASLHFIYSAMNAGKSTDLIQAAYNYNERKMEVLILKASIDTRDGDSVVKSRIGLEMGCVMFNTDENLFDLVKNKFNGVACVFVDEAQFMTKEQVDQLTDVVDLLDIPVMAYGLRTDSNGDAFPGSARLLAVADKLPEKKTICHCGKKADMVLRLSDTGEVIKGGDQIQIGGNDRYVSVCRKHWKAGAID